MNLFSRVKAHENERKAIIKEYEGVIAVREGYVQIYDVESFLEYSNGKNVEITERRPNNLNFNYEATFSVEGIRYIIVLEDAEKEELEKLINEREAEGLADGIKTI